MGAVATTSQSKLTLDEVLSFLQRTGINEHAFGMLTINDPRLTYNLEKGHTYTDVTVNTIRLFMQNYDEKFDG